MTPRGKIILAVEDLKIVVHRDYMERTIQDLVNRYGEGYIFNTAVAKGSIGIVSPETGDIWFIVDKKTPGYGFPKFVGRYVLTGGNWRGDVYATPSFTPLSLYKRQLDEELSKHWPGRLMPVLKPHWDYLEVLTVEDHGNENLRETLSLTNGTVYALVSQIGAEIERAELEHVLEIARGDLTPSHLLGKIRNSDIIEGKDPGLAILTKDKLDVEVNNFAAGDGIKFADYIRDMYGINVSTTPTNGTSVRLNSSYASVPYANREELRFLRVNPLRQEIKDAGAPFKKL